MNMTFPQLNLLAQDKYRKRSSTPFTIRTESPEAALAIVRAARARKVKEADG